MRQLFLNSFINFINSCKNFDFGFTKNLFLGEKLKLKLELKFKNNELNYHEKLKQITNYKKIEIIANT